MKNAFGEFISRWHSWGKNLWAKEYISRILEKQREQRLKKKTNQHPRSMGQLLKSNMQLTKQHGFELHWFTYTEILFSSKYYSTAWYKVGWICRCGTANTEEPRIWRNCIWRANYKLTISWNCILIWTALPS